jgi:hypothetical protein
MSQTSTYLPIDPNIIYVSHVPLISSGLFAPSVEDLSCNMINVKATCKGALQIATTPHQANIYIYEEIHGDYILRTEKTGTMLNPSVITDMECTGPTRSNKFKLTLAGYVDVEGILDITDGTVYQLYMIMEKCAITESGGDFLIPALVIGGIMLFLLGEDKRQHKLEDYDKYKEIYE